MADEAAVDDQAQSAGAKTDPVLHARLPEPLIATLPVANADRFALAHALARYERRSRVDDMSALTEYLQDHPASPWRVSLLVNLGIEHKHYGYLSRALDAYESAWREGKSANDAPLKQLVDRAVGELALLRAELGHRERVDALLAEIADRPITNPGHQWIQQARETQWVMQNDPKHLYLCGPMALKSLLLEQGATREQLKFLDHYRADPKGVTLMEVARLAGEARAPLSAVFRKPDQALPAPSVAHLKTGHFIAIVGEEKGGYRVKDPVLGRHDRWMSAEAIDAEASGYFLASTGDIERKGWRSVGVGEAGDVWGTGPTTGDGSDNGDSGSGDGGDNPCMCGYDIAELAVGVRLTDQPVGYAPAIGPSAKIRFRYRQRQTTQPAVFSYFNVSPNWTFNWMRYVQDDPAQLGQSVTRYREDGTVSNYSSYNSTTRSFAPEESDGATLTLTSLSPVTYQRALRDGTIEIYSQSDGRTSFPRNVFLKRIIDPQGNALTLNYTASGGQVKLISLTDATGRNTTFTYGLAAKPLLITRVADPFGRSASLAYDASGRLISITDMIGIVSRFTYDASSLVNSLITPYGATRFAFGASGSSRFVEITDPLGLREREETLQPAPVPFSDPIAPNMNPFNSWLNYRDSFHWDKHQYALAGCTPTGGCNYGSARVKHFYHDKTNINIEWYTLQALKQPLETRVWYNYPGQPQNLYSGTYDLPSVVGRVVDGRTSQLSSKTYNAAGNPIQIIDPAGRTTNIAYAANLIDPLRVEQVTASGPQTLASFTFNAKHRPLTYTDAAGRLTRYAYNAAGQLTQLTLPTGAVWGFAYNAFGRLIRVTNPNGRTRSGFTYDGFDRVATATDSEGHTLRYAYDAADRVARITYPDGTRRLYTYNRLDLASVTDRQGRITRYAYDANRRLTSVTDPVGGVTRYAYWESGKLKSITDPKGNVTSWSIDIQSRTSAKQYADGSRVVYGYDDAGRLKLIRDALGQIKLYRYTVDNRLAGVSYSNAANPTPAVSFTYDPSFPRLASVSDGQGATTYTYGAVGALGALQLVGEAQPLGAINYAYDALGRMTRRSVAGNVETFQYDALDRLIQHVDPLGQFALAYLGQTEQLSSSAQSLATQYPARSLRTYLANVGDRRLASIANVGMQRFGYTTNVEGLATAATETARNWTYRYDADNRLTVADSSTGLLNRSTFDPNGNVTALGVSAGTIAFTYNNLNELVRKAASGAAAVNYSYNANGNLLSDGARSYSYDAEGRLVGIAYAGSAAKSTFAYDGLGRRVAITETPASGSPVTTYYQWCGERICRQRNAAGATLRLYYDEGETLATTGQKLYYGQDRLGSTRNVAVATGATGVLKSLDYDPFGAALNAPTGPLPDFRYAGMFFHGRSGLYLTHYRAYDPRILRWLSRDPLGERAEVGSPGQNLSPKTAPLSLLWAWAPLPATKASGNLYAYGSSDPINRVDPLGLDDKCEKSTLNKWLKLIYDLAGYNPLVSFLQTTGNVFGDINDLIPHQIQVPPNLPRLSEGGNPFGGSSGGPSQGPQTTPGPGVGPTGVPIPGNVSLGQNSGYGDPNQGGLPGF